MTNTLKTIATITALTIALSACTPEQRMHGKAPGSYDSTETTTDANGTTTVRESTTEVTIDENGKRKETITTKVTKDPAGLMNKTSRKTKQTTEQK